MHSQVTSAIEAAITYLLDSRMEQGWWQDFELTAPGVSDEWVTAYVGTALAAVPHRRAYQGACDAWSLLLARRQPVLASRQSARPKPEGWGHNATLPADADSTGWALRLAHALGRGNPYAHDWLVNSWRSICTPMEVWLPIGFGGGSQACLR